MLARAFTDVLAVALSPSGPLAHVHPTAHNLGVARHRAALLRFARCRADLAHVSRSFTPCPPTCSRTLTPTIAGARPTRPTSYSRATAPLGRSISGITPARCGPDLPFRADVHRRC